MANYATSDFPHQINLNSRYPRMLEIFTWCDENIGGENVRWQWRVDIGTSEYIFAFADPEVATLFALKWM